MWIFVQCFVNIKMTLNMSVTMYSSARIYAMALSQSDSLTQWFVDVVMGLVMKKA